MSSARSWPSEISPSGIGQPASTPTMPATVNCCQRRGGRVSGSDSMKAPRKRNGDDHRICQKRSSAATSMPAAWYCAAVRSTATATATTRKTATTRIFSVRQSTARPSTSTGAASAGVPTHHADVPRAGHTRLSSVRTVAPTAAGLKMWRPRHARRYFDSDAAAPARAIPPRAARSRVGRSTNSRMCAVISEDSRRHGRCSTRWAAASTPTDTAESTARVTISSSGPGPTRSKSDSTSAMTASVASAR
jgi:hypothetical protein